MIKYRDVQATKETAYDIEVYQSKWTTGIKGLLDRCGMSFLWDQYCNVNKKWTKKSIEVRLDDTYERSYAQECNSQGFNNRVCTNYSHQRSITSEVYLLKLNIHELSQSL